MTNFEYAYKKVMEYEGGYSVDPNDSGGETYKGVSRRSFPKWKGWDVIDGYKHKTSFPYCLDSDEELQDMILEFYKNTFWNVFNLDDIRNKYLAYEVFEQAINLGVYITSGHIQKVCNALNYNSKYGPDLLVDNRIGVNTRNRLHKLAAATKQTQSALLNGLNSLQGAYYVNLGNKRAARSDYRKYTKGWLSKRNEGYAYE